MCPLSLLLSLLYHWTSPPLHRPLPPGLNPKLSSSAAHLSRTGSRQIFGFQQQMMQINPLIKLKLVHSVVVLTICPLFEAKFLFKNSVYINTIIRSSLLATSCCITLWATSHLLISASNSLTLSAHPSTCCLNCREYKEEETRGE